MLRTYAQTCLNSIMVPVVSRSESYADIRSVIGISLC